MRFLATLAAAATLALVSTAATAAFGDPDPTFSAPSVPGFGNCSVAPQVLGDQSILQLYQPTLAGGTTGGVMRLRADGSLDTAWGNEGRTEWARPSLDMSPVRILRHPDGGFLVVGKYVVRLRPDGQVDTSYGTNGQSEPFSPYGPDAPSEPGVFSSSFVVHSVAAMPDGGVAALITELRLFPVFTNTVVSVARIDANGRALGRTGLPVSPSQRVYAWGVQADGQVQFGTYPVGRDIAGLPLVENGAFAPSLQRAPERFGFSESPGLLPRDVAAAWVEPSVTVDALGRVYFADACAGGPCGSAALGVMRFFPDDPSGRRDTTFGQDGLVTWSDGRGMASQNFVDRYMAHALWQGSDGVITIVLRHTSGGGRAIIFDYASRAIRLGADGSLVPTFANDLQVGHADSRFAQLDDGRFVQTDFMEGSCGRVVRKQGDLPKGSATLAEYEYRGRYFITAEGLETAILDAEPAAEKLRRTGRTMGAWLPAAGLPGSLPMCRFTGDVAAGPRGHFWALQGAGCDLVRADDVRLPAGTRTWRFEGLAFSETPTAADGSCPANLQPVRRLFNDGFRRGIDPAHRFATDPAVIAEMQAKGWVLEGVAFCAPPVMR